MYYFHFHRFLHLVLQDIFFLSSLKCLFLIQYMFLCFSGCGDFTISDMHYLSDPCPTPDREKRRSLSEKERMIYAPMSGVGGIVYDKDAVYIDLGGSHSHKQTEEV